MNIPQLETHIRTTTSTHRDQLNLSDDDLEDTIKRLLIVLYSCHRRISEDQLTCSSPSKAAVTRRTIRKHLWDAVQDWDFTHSARMVIDLCFPAQLGILGNAGDRRGFSTIDRRSSVPPAYSDVTVASVGSAENPVPDTALSGSTTNDASTATIKPAPTNDSPFAVHYSVKVTSPAASSYIFDELGPKEEATRIIKTAFEKILKTWTTSIRKPPANNQALRWPWHPIDLSHETPELQGIGPESGLCLVVHHGSEQFSASDTNISTIIQYYLRHPKAETQVDVHFSDEKPGADSIQRSVERSSLSNDLHMFCSFVRYHTEGIATLSKALVTSALRTSTGTMTTILTALWPLTDARRRLEENAPNGLVIWGPDSVTDDLDRKQIGKDICSLVELDVVNNWCTDRELCEKVDYVVNLARETPWRLFAVTLSISSESAVAAEGLQGWESVLHQYKNILLLVFLTTAVEHKKRSLVHNVCLSLGLESVYIPRPSPNEKERLIQHIVENYANDDATKLLPKSAVTFLAHSSLNFSRVSLRACVYSILDEQFCQRINVTSRSSFYAAVDVVPFRDMHAHLHRVARKHQISYSHPSELDAVHSVWRATFDSQEAIADPDLLEIMQMRYTELRDDWSKGDTAKQRTLDGTTGASADVVGSWIWEDVVSAAACLAGRMSASFLMGIHCLQGAKDDQVSSLQRIRLDALYHNDSILIINLVNVEVSGAVEAALLSFQRMVGGGSGNVYIIAWTDKQEVAKSASAWGSLVIRCT
ncbi:uncharacterized protein SPPG_00582 [Spizellomyces punctatus DAOM BR117]|uniref:Uncharacterized protein n=1 Tax=Spizellomyces punctatus (strain DAOM BR117) TaxID=645134 RepID=A0A0L0HVF3_SPIPD|nr:uncharacterized protein SPPG_00582 [Spizellomyces punctatus DAOM BR117]KND04885.1 hypothetical protein SPPG_00582 [Spizellomyces punctatus DAOM BR117]|eukprot:XP_016612924.1 hypothetical protein SPPG_00582 [Spizellomyces punctatus DAOM BR117]